MPNDTEQDPRVTSLQARHSLTEAEALFVTRRVSEAGADEAEAVNYVKAQRVGADAPEGPVPNVPGGDTAQASPNTVQEQLNRASAERDRLNVEIERLERSVEDQTLPTAKAAEEPTAEAAPAEVAPEEEVETGRRGRRS